MTKNLLLNAGCGHRPLAGYVNVDIDPGSGADVVCDLQALPFRSGIFSGIRSVHVLEHLCEDMWRDRAEVSRAVLEFARVLRDDGYAEVEVPSPQGEDAVRGDHLTVYGHVRLFHIFQFYFQGVTCRGVGSWVQARVLNRVFARLSKWDPFWGNAYSFRLERPIRREAIVKY